MERCAHCGNENPPEAKFCNACGRQIAGTTDPVEKPPSVLPDLWRQIPRLPYLLAAIVIVGLAFALKSVISDPNFEKRAKVVADRLQSNLELLDIVNLAITYGQAAKDHILDCDERCLEMKCPFAMTWSECSLPCLSGDAAVCLRCRERDETKERCVPRMSCSYSCKGSNPVSVITAPPSAALRTAKILWAQLHWSVFIVAALSALLAAGLVAGMLEHFTGSVPNGWFVFLLAPPVALAIAFSLKWILIACLIVFGYAIGLLIWGAGVALAIYQVYSTAHRLQSMVEGRPRH